MTPNLLVRLARIGKLSFESSRVDRVAHAVLGAVLHVYRHCSYAPVLYHLFHLNENSLLI